MVYVDPRPDAATLASMYADPGYHEDGYALGVESESYFDRRDELVEHYERVATDLIRETGAASRDLFELGAAGGFFLEGARRAGWHVCGVELSAPAARYAQRELGLDVFEGEMDDAPLHDRSFDVTYADNVIEHTASPESAIKTLYGLTRPGGHLVAIVPTYVNSAYYRALLLLESLVPPSLLGPQLMRVLKFDRNYDGGYPYHIHEFDDRSISTLIERAGFRIVSRQGSIPLPAHLFEETATDPKTRALRGLFSGLDGLMRARIIPGARLRILAQRPH